MNDDTLCPKLSPMLHESPWRLIVFAQYYNTQSKKWRPCESWSLDNTFPNDSVDSPFGGDQFKVALEAPALCAKLFTESELSPSPYHSAVLSFCQRFALFPFAGDTPEIKRIDSIDGFPVDSCSQHKEFVTNLISTTKYVKVKEFTWDNLKAAGYEKAFREQFRTFARYAKRIKKNLSRQNIDEFRYIAVLFEVDNDGSESVTGESECQSPDISQETVIEYDSTNSQTEVDSNDSESSRTLIERDLSSSLDAVVHPDFSMWQNFDEEIRDMYMWDSDPTFDKFDIPSYNSEDFALPPLFKSCRGRSDESVSMSCEEDVEENLSPEDTRTPDSQAFEALLEEVYVENKKEESKDLSIRSSFDLESGDFSFLPRKRRRCCHCHCCDGEMEPLLTAPAADSTVSGVEFASINCTYVVVGENRFETAQFARWLAMKRDVHVSASTGTPLQSTQPISLESPIQSLIGALSVVRDVCSATTTPVVNIDGWAMCSTDVVRFLRLETSATVLVRVPHDLPNVLPFVGAPVSCIVLCPSTLYSDLRYSLRLMIDNFHIQPDEADELLAETNEMLATLSDTDAVVVPINSLSSGFSKPVFLRNVFAPENAASANHSVYDVDANLFR